MKKQTTTIQQKEKITKKDIINWGMDIIKIFGGAFATYLIKTLLS